MPTKLMDCGTMPSDSGCTLRIAGQEEEVLAAAAAHAVAVHGHEDTAELRESLRGMLVDAEPGFIQVLEFRTDDIDSVNAAQERWMSETQGERTALHSVQCADRDDPGRYVVVVEFPSYEAAMANSGLPATGQLAEQMGKLATAGPTFRNLDVVRIVV